MDDDLRMKLADLGSPEALADCIIDHFADIEVPVPLDRIAEAVGIVEVIGQRTDGFEGVLITDAAKVQGIDRLQRFKSAWSAADSRSRMSSGISCSRFTARTPSVRKPISVFSRPRTRTARAKPKLTGLRRRS